jgi:hypothetical protein
MYSARILGICLYVTTSLVEFVSQKTMQDSFHNLRQLRVVPLHRFQNFLIDRSPSMPGRL